MRMKGEVEAVGSDQGHVAEEGEYRRRRRRGDARRAKVIREPHGLPPLEPSGRAGPWNASVSCTRPIPVKVAAAAVLHATTARLSGRPCFAWSQRLIS